MADSLNPDFFDSFTVFVDKIQKWTTSMDISMESHLEGRGSILPSSEDLEYIYRGPMKNCLLFMIDHVKPVDIVKEIRGNLRLQQHNVNNRDITNDQFVIDEEKRQIRDEYQKIIIKEEKLEDLTESLQFTLAKTHLLEACERKAKIRIESMITKEKSLQTVLKKLNKKSSEMKEMAIFVQPHVVTTFPAAVCMKNVRVICNQIANSLKSIVDSKLEAKPQPLLRMNYEKLCQSLLLDNGCDVILQCITNMSQSTMRSRFIENDGTKKMNATTAHYETLAEIPGFARSFQASKSFAKIKSIEIKIIDMTLEFNEVNRRINEKLTEIHSNSAVDAVLISKTAIEEQLLEVGQEAESAFLQKRIADVEIELQTSVARNGELMNKRSLIERDEIRLKTLLSDVHILLSKLEMYRSNFNEHQQFLKESLKNTFDLKKLESLSRSLCSLHDHVSIEMNSLLFETSGNQTMTSTRMDERTPEPIEVLKAKEAMRLTDVLLSSIDDALKDMNAEFETCTPKDLVKYLAYVREKKMNVWFPQVHEFSEKTTKFVEQTNEPLMQAVSTSFEPPARNIELGFKIEGKTLSDFLIELERPSNA